MTAIAGYTDGTTMVLGADSLATRGCEALTLDQPKVWKTDAALIGACGTPRAIQIARYGLPGPCQRPGNVDTIETIYRWINDFRERCKALSYGLDGKDDDGVDFVVGMAGRFYEIRGNGSIVTLTQPYATSGCGGPEARAAMYALLNFQGGWAPRVLVQRGLETAAAFNTHVRAPFHFVEQAVGP